jgi:hypothetical protein
MDPLIPWLVKEPLKVLVKNYRRLTASFRGLPDFLIIGGRKCGSTSIYHYLTEHPCVLPALKKEVFYFTHFFEKGEMWYRLHFPTVLERWLYTQTTGVRSITGEASPNYIQCSLAPERVYAMNPAVKLIVVLRDPVAAAYSAYQFGILRGSYTADRLRFRDIVENELSQLACSKSLHPDANPGLLLPRYVYVDQLSRWFDIFPAAQIQILFLETFALAPQEHYDQLVQFLGLPSYHLTTFEPHNTNNYRSMDQDLFERLRSFYRPHNHRLAEATGLPIPLEWDGPAVTNRVPSHAGS